MELGTFVTVDGQPGVQFDVELSAPLEEVWSAVTEPHQVSQWFPSTLVFEPTVGGEVRFSGDPHMDDLKGRVLDYEPRKRFAFTWGASTVSFTLSRVELNATRFVLLNLLESSNEAARNAAGWQVCLEQLELLLREGKAQGPHGQAGADWRSVYEAYVAVGFPSGARIPE